MDVYYKVLDEAGVAIYSACPWNLPDGDKPGEWMPRIEGKLKLCYNGYHACKRDNLVEWLGPRLFEVEFRGEVVEGDNKLVGRQARLVREFTTWNERTARLFACDCAEHVLHIYENKHPEDSRMRDCIETARKFANGNATPDELAAAGDAAWAAIEAAAVYAARAAAWSAARSAARYAAEAAAWSTTWSAAVYAAGSAAWSAAEAAAGSAAEAAAGYAIRHTAWAAEIDWQTTRLFEYLNGKRGR